jgi:hypothetical protein
LKQHQKKKGYERGKGVLLSSHFFSVGEDTVFAARNNTAAKVRVMVIFILLLLHGHVLSLETKCLGLNVTLSVAFLFKSTTFSKFVANQLIIRYCFII